MYLLIVWIALEYLQRKGLIFDFSFPHVGVKQENLRVSFKKCGLPAMLSGIFEDQILCVFSQMLACDE